MTGRQATAALTRGPLEKHDKEALAGLNALPIGRFVRNATQHAPRF